MSHELYLLITTGFPRNHHSLYLVRPLQSPSDACSGQVFQVTGNIQVGMKYEVKYLLDPPESSPDFLSKEFLGALSEDEEGRLAAICESVEVPKKQFEGARRLFPREETRRCQEWTRDAVNALREQGILKQQDN